MPRVITKAALNNAAEIQREYATLCCGSIHLQALADLSCPKLLKTVKTLVSSLSHQDLLRIAAQLLSEKKMQEILFVDASQVQIAGRVGTSAQKKEKKAKKASEASLDNADNSREEQNNSVDMDHDVVEHSKHEATLGKEETHEEKGDWEEQENEEGGDEEEQENGDDGVNQGEDDDNDGGSGDDGYERVKVLNPAGKSQRDPKVAGMSYDEVWNYRYQELIAYKNKHGHANVTKCPADFYLSYWVKSQRYFYYKGKLSEERIQKLTDLGFQFDRGEQLKIERRKQRERTERELAEKKRNSLSVREGYRYDTEMLGKSFEERWEHRYNQLVAFKEENGHPHVSENKSLDADPCLNHLAFWVREQRVLYRKEKLSGERINKLIKLGFQFDRAKRLKADRAAKHSVWFQRYQELLKFFRAKGNSNVPADYPPNPPLGRWVANQRRAYKVNQLPQDQIKMLLSLKFEFMRPPGRHMKDEKDLKRPRRAAPTSQEKRNLGTKSGQEMIDTTESKASEDANYFDGSSVM